MGYLTALQWGIVTLSCGTIVLLAWKGRTPERVAAGCLSVLMFGTNLIDLHSRFAVAGLSIAALGLLVWLAMRHDRWWLIAASGLQLIAVATHLIPLVEPGMRLWAAVTVRIIVWTLIMFAGLFGVGEALWAPYARRSPGEFPRASRPV